MLANKSLKMQKSCKKQSSVLTIDNKQTREYQQQMCEK